MACCKNRSGKPVNSQPVAHTKRKNTKMVVKYSGERPVRDSVPTCYSAIARRHFLPTHRMQQKKTFEFGEIGVSAPGVSMTGDDTLLDEYRTRATIRFACCRAKIATRTCALMRRMSGTKNVDTDTIKR